MRYITVEEHFASPGFLAGPGRAFKGQLLNVGFMGQQLLDRLCDVGASRLSEMDAAEIDMQVLSLNYPGLEQSEAAEAIAVAQEANDFLRRAVESNPKRFAGLAALPMCAPVEAAAELELRVRQQSFKGAIINGHSKGRYLDDKFFWPILERAEALDVPLYLHPTMPTKAVIDATYSGFSPQVNFLFAGPAWGWHIETGMHVIRMVLGGVFDRFPKLQVVVGHMGEGLPFMLPRLNSMLPMEATKLQRPVAAYLRENLHYTFGAFNYPATYLNLVLEVGIERILFSVDYPYGSMTEGRVFLEGIAASTADKERIAYSNAKTLFKL